MLARCEAQIEVGTGGRKTVTQVANWKRDSRERPALSIAGGYGDPQAICHTSYCLRADTRFDSGAMDSRRGSRWLRPIGVTCLANRDHGLLANGPNTCKYGLGSIPATPFHFIHLPPLDANICFPTTNGITGPTPRTMNRTRSTPRSPSRRKKANRTSCCA